MNTVYREMLEAMVKKEIAQQGEKALNLAKHVKEMHVAQDGTVTLLGDGFKAVQRLVEEFKKISPITIIFLRGAVEPILKRNPEVKVPEELLSDEAKRVGYRLSREDEERLHALKW